MRVMLIIVQFFTLTMNRSLWNRLVRDCRAADDRLSMRC